MQFKKTATIVLAATMIVTSFSFNTVSASETAEAVDQVNKLKIQNQKELQKLHSQISE